MRIIKGVLSIVVGLGLLAATVSSASAVEFSKRTCEKHPGLCSTRRGDSKEYPDVEKKQTEKPPEMEAYDERQLFKKLGNENPRLVGMLAKCHGELFCLATLFKAREEHNGELFREQAVNFLVLDGIAAGLPSLKDYLIKLRDDAAKSGDQVYAGKFAVAVEQVLKTTEILADLRAYFAQKSEAASKEDQEGKP